MKSLGKHRVIIKSIHGLTLTLSTEIVREVFTEDQFRFYIRVPGLGTRFLQVDRNTLAWQGKRKHWYSLDVIVPDVDRRIVDR